MVSVFVSTPLSLRSVRAVFPHSLTVPLTLSPIVRSERRKMNEPVWKVTPYPASTRPRWWWYLPSAILIGVACHQIWLTHSADLNPWSGGGFGMFSTMDAWGNRHLQAFAIRPGIRRELEIPAFLREAVRRACAFPSEARLQALAVELVNVPTPDAGPLEAIEIHVWSTHYDPITLASSGSLLRSLRVPIDRR
jgi:hypothetical protein